MVKYLDEAKWDRLIAQTDWYMGEIWDEIKKLPKSSLSEETKKKIRVEIRNYFADRLATGQVALGEGKIYMDAERKDIDIIVIHHTSSDEPYSLQYLNAVHLLNIYVPYFRKPLLPSEKKFKGGPIQSGHFYGGSQVFWGYHWFINVDGRAERILQDKAIGWHAGNWGINCRSVGICLDGDLTGKQPSRGQLNTLSLIVQENYSHIDNLKIIGHKEANPKTECPGDTFQKWCPKPPAVKTA